MIIKRGEIQLKQSCRAVLFAVVMSSCCWGYSGGSGTEQDPYQISVVADWQELMNSPEGWDKHFVLTADVDLEGVALTPIGKSWNLAFSGVFDGNGYVIHNVVIDLPDSDNVAVFGCVGSGGKIQNLGAENVNIAGFATVGGLVGENKGTLRSSYAIGQVTSISYSAGGLVGYNGGGLIISCYAVGQVTGDYDVGGLVGNNSGVVMSCRTVASSNGVGAHRDAIGGLVGNNNGVVISCYATGTVTGYDSVGGFGGYNSGTLASCYAIGPVQGITDVGGLVGNTERGITNACFWDVETSGQATSDGGDGKTTAEMQDINTFLDAGWDFVEESTNGTHQFWYMSDSDYPRLALLNAFQPLPLSGSGTEADPYLVHDANELGAVCLHDLSANYRFTSNIDLSGIRWSASPIQSFSGSFDGAGFTVGNLTVEGGDLLGLFGRLNETAEVKDIGIEDMDVTGRNYIGGLVAWNCGIVMSCSATGQVSGLEWVGSLGGVNNGTFEFCSATAQVSGTWGWIGGLVGENFGEMIFCHTAAVVIGGDHDNVGGLAGSNRGILHSCYVTGEVSGGYNFVGGLVGNNNGEILSCFATAKTEGSNYVGGLVGFNDGWIISCYAMGSVTGIYDYIGGLVGQNYYILSSCYAVGQVSGNDYVGGLVGDNYEGYTVTACFWDTETSGQTTSGGGEGKTTAEMKDIDTFLNAGWDFVGERVNGSEDFWKMTCPAMSYPKLSYWEPVPGDFYCPDGVDFIDLDNFAAYWLNSDCSNYNHYCDYADLNTDGFIDFTDYSILARNWLVE